jgi:choice-of-anchor A domain-containing protein
MSVVESLASALTALVLTAGVAPAATLTAQGLLSGFNTIALGNLTASSETEGTVFVGGNLSSNGYGVNPKNLVSGTVGSVSGSLIVGGSVSGNPINVGAGNVVIGGTTSAIINRNGGGTLTTGATIDVAGVSSTLNAFSVYLSGLATTSGASISTADQNNKALTSGAGGTGALANIAILNLTAAQSTAFLGSGNLSSLNLTSGVTTIVNLAGTSAAITGNFNLNNTSVLFNFYEATTLTIGAAFGFGILAPKAAITTTGGGVNGVVVGNSITQSIEFRPLNGTAFSGTLPVQTSPVSAVPLPASALLLGAGMLGLAALRRRKSV